MKGLHWRKIPDSKLDKTAWSSIQDDSVSLPIAELEERFGVVESTKPAAAAAVAKPEARKGPKLLLPPKTQQNCGIALARLRMSANDVADQLLGEAPAEKQMTEEQLTLLASNLVPSAEDMSILQDYDGDVSELGTLEKFFLELDTVSAVGERVELLQTRARWPAQVSKLRGRIELVAAAVEACTNALHTQPEQGPLAAMLQLVLALGNYLNAGTARGGAWGFPPLDVLPKLQQLKASKGKSTLLTFCAELALKPEHAAIAQLPSLLMPALRAVGSESLQAVQEEVDAVKSAAASCSRAASSLREKDDGAKFVAIVAPFVAEAQEDAEQLSIMTKEATASFASLATALAEDPSRVDSLNIFPVLYKFVRSLDEEMTAAREAAAAAADKAAKPRSASPPLPSKPKPASLVDSIYGDVTKKKGSNIIAEMKARQARKAAQRTLRKGSLKEALTPH